MPNLTSRRCYYLISFFATLFVVFVVSHSEEFCSPVKPSENPTSVHKLKPSDVKIVMALGDSITAAFSAYNSVFENRGASWCIGGDDNATTMVNILQSVAPHPLFGASLGTHLPELPGWPYYHSDVCNAAQSTAKIEQLDHQVERLYSVLESNDVKNVGKGTGKVTIDLEKDWKVLTILIGANNICRTCIKQEYDEHENPDEFERLLRKLLIQVQARIPRVFVNLVQLFNISQVYDLSKPDEHCMTRHKEFFMECPCLFSKGNDTDREFMDQVVQEYNQRMIKVAKEFENLDEFAVVVQPMFRGMKIPSLDYLSHIDCFHPLYAAHKAMAVSLWNAMITPANKKKHTIDFNEKILCPDDSTLLYTT